MTTAENPNAGQGPVVLDIGGDIGAMIVVMPAALDGVEVEIIPTGTDARPGRHGHADPASPVHEHGDHQHGDHDHDHADHEHGDHQHGADGQAGHSHAAGAPPHVAVVARPAPDGSVIHSLVYPELSAGTYDLYIRPDGPIQLTATVSGGEVTHAQWPVAEASPN